MGSIRFFLAACVVAGHSSAIIGLPALDAGAAVKAFFVISGFYMALILDRKYDGTTAEGRRLFWSNRVLRIYPPYLAAVLFAVVFYVAASWYLHRPVDRFEYWQQAWTSEHHAAFLPLLISQLSVVGLDLTPAFGFSPTRGFMLLASAMPSDVIPAWRFNLLPHAWSIGVELLFYLGAPWLCRWRAKGLIGLVIATIALKMVASRFLPAPLAEAFAYHFTPFQIGYFALGILAYQWRHALAGGKAVWRVSVPVWCILLAGIAWGGLIMKRAALAQEVAPIAMALGAPSVFALTRGWWLDRMVGELSYSLYLMHVPCKWVLNALQGCATKDALTVSGNELLLLSVAASGLMFFMIERPVDRWREQRVQGARLGHGGRA